MLTRFPLDPTKLNSPQQVRSFATYQRVLASRDSIIKSALDLDGTADDYDGNHNDHVVLFEKELGTDGPLFTGFADADGTIGMDSKRQTTGESGTTTTQTSIEFRHLEEKGHDLLTHKASQKTVDNMRRRTKTDWLDVFEINQVDGYVLHQSEVTH